MSSVDLKGSCLLHTMKYGVRFLRLCSLYEKNNMSRNSPVIQWLGLLALTAEDGGLILGWGTKIPEVARHGQKKKKSDKLNM